MALPTHCDALLLTSRTVGSFPRAYGGRRERPEGGTSGMSITQLRGVIRRRSPVVGIDAEPEQRTNAQLLRPALMRWPAPPYLLLADAGVFLLLSVLPSAHPVQVVVFAVMITCFWIFRLYQSRLSMSLLNDLPFLALGVAAALLTEVAATSSLPNPSPHWSQAGRMTTVLAGIVLARAIAYSAVRRARCNGHVRHTAMIIGAGRVALRLGRALEEHREYGLNVVGFVDPQPRTEAGNHFPAPVFDRHEDLAALIEDFAVKVVLVAFGSVREEQLVQYLRTCDRLACEIFIVPRLFEMHNVARDMDQIWGIPLIRVRRTPFRGLSWKLKRSLDVVVVGSAMLLLSPVLLACAFAVRIEGGPGVLFRQERVGLDGRCFTLLKFRSLKPATDHESATRWNVSFDDRVGRVGRFLRKSSLDELPQLWNILKGDMSLVGPRPERPYFVEQFQESIPRYMARHRVPVGLTGWAQVHGLRGDTSIESRASFDNYYIQNWSLWGDIKILLRTIQQVLWGRGA